MSHRHWHGGGGVFGGDVLRLAQEVRWPDAFGDEATALHYAVSVGNLESVKLLINAGLDSNAADDQGQTPLHLAIRFEHWGNHRSTQAFEKIIGHLLENDASLRFKNNKGITPYQLAKELKSPGPILELLRKKQEEGDSKRNAIDAR